MRNLFANGGHLLLRSEAVQAAGGFLPGIVFGEDWEFWIRIALQGPFSATPRGRRCCSSDSIQVAPIIVWHSTQPLSRPAWMRSSPIRRCSPGSARGDWPQSAAAPRPRTTGSSAANCFAMAVGPRALSGFATPSGRIHAMKRAALLAAAFVLPLLPPGLRGPFRSYRVAQRSALR